MLFMYSIHTHTHSNIYKRTPTPAKNGYAISDASSSSLSPYIYIYIYIYMHLYIQSIYLSITYPNAREERMCHQRRLLLFLLPLGIVLRLRLPPPVFAPPPPR